MTYECWVSGVLRVWGVQLDWLLYIRARDFRRRFSRICNSAGVSIRICNPIIEFLFLTFAAEKSLQKLYIYLIELQILILTPAGFLLRQAAKPSGKIPAEPRRVSGNSMGVLKITPWVLPETHGVIFLKCRFFPKSHGVFGRKVPLFSAKVPSFFSNSLLSFGRLRGAKHMA